DDIRHMASRLASPDAALSDVATGNVGHIPVLPHYAVQLRMFTDGAGRHGALPWSHRPDDAHGPTATSSRLDSFRDPPSTCRARQGGGALRTDDDGTPGDDRHRFRIRLTWQELDMVARIPVPHSVVVALVVLLIVVTGPATAALARSQSAGEVTIGPRGDAALSGAMPGSGPTTEPTVLWEASSNGGGIMGMAIDDDVFYFATKDPGAVVAVDRTT